MRIQPFHNTGVVPPYLAQGNNQSGPVNGGNTGIVPPHLQDQLQPGQPCGNTGIVPPHLQEKLRQGPRLPEGNTGVVPPHLQGDCFPQVPAQKDEAGVEVIFTDVKLPTARRPLVDLSGGAPRFTQLPVRGNLFN